MTPLFDALLVTAITATEVIVDMVKSFLPGLNTSFFQFHVHSAESTPEVFLKLFPNLFRFRKVMRQILLLNLVIFHQMGLITFKMKQHFIARLSVGVLATLPGLLMVMLRVFMALPVILAAKPLLAIHKSAAIRPIVSFHMFPQLTRPSDQFMALMAW